MNRVIKFIVPSNFLEVTFLGQAISQICKLSALTEDESVKIELVVVEMLTNVVRHAYNMQDGHKIEVSLNLLEEKIIIEVYDVGLSLDVSLLSQPMKEDDFSVSIGSLPEGGRGLQIIRSIADEVTYSSTNGINCMVALINRVVRAA